ncbi:MAG: DNA pilot protein [Microviridae sp.]|nr:MAG: DNA pilot protein [Microviridae sp.]
MFGIDDALLGSLAGGLFNNFFAGERQEDQQQFNSAQTAETRAWEERMSNTAYQRATNDLRSAGLNPMLALMHGGASTPSVAPASSGIAGPGNNFDFPAAMQTASNIALQTATKDKTEAEAAKTRAEEKEVIARTPTHAVSIDQMQQNIEESKSRIVKILQEASTSAYSAANIAQQTINLQELIPQIRATISNLQAHTKLAGAQTTLAGAQTTLAGATTAQTGALTQETQQRISANLPALENALKNLERVREQMAMPQHAQDEAVHDSYLGSLSAAMRALNPFTNIMPTVGIKGTGTPAPQPGRKDWKK